MVFKFFVMLVLIQVGCFAMPNPDINVNVNVDINGSSDPSSDKSFDEPDIYALIVANGGCDCNYVFPKGCKIVVAAPPGKACECTNTSGSRCRGDVVNCIDPESKYCKHPDTSCNSCRQAAGSNCGGSC